MTGRMTRVVLKRPAEAFVSPEKIEQEWQQLGFLAPPDLAKASQEFSQLEEILRQEGVEILYLPADGRTTLDSIYTHDPVIVTEAGAIILQMGKKERAGEPEALEEALRSWGIPILGRLTGTATAEGGDLLWLDEKRWLPAAALEPIREAFHSFRKFYARSELRSSLMTCLTGKGPAKSFI